MGGWFAVKHGITEHPMFAGRPHWLGAWVVILDKAAFADCTQDIAGQAVKVKRGELCASQAMLEKWTGLPRQQLRTFLIGLERHGAIKTRPATKSTKSRTIVSVCNYDTYQTVQPKTNQGSTKDQPIKEQDKQIPVGSADKSALDLASIIFTKGVDYLKASGVKDRSARSLLGKWRKEHGDGATIEALGKAQREGAIDPVQYVEGVFRFQKPKKINGMDPVTASWL